MNATTRRTDQIAAALGQEILSGTLPPGSKLPSDTHLCQRFGVSRTILREAFRLLTAKGLLMARPRIGTLVAEKAAWALWDQDMLHWRVAAGQDAALATEIDDIRIALEPSLAALAANRADTQANQALQTALRALEAEPQAEATFLAALYAASGNPMAAAAVHLAQWAVSQRAAPLPLAAYRQATAAIAQKQPSAARQAILAALITD